MLQRSRERETLHYLQLCSVPRSSLKNNLCHSPMEATAKLIAMQETIIRVGRHGEAAWQLQQTALHRLVTSTPHVTSQQSTASNVSKLSNPVVIMCYKIKYNKTIRHWISLSRSIYLLNAIFCCSWYSASLNLMIFMPKTALGILIYIAFCSLDEMIFYG